MKYVFTKVSRERDMWYYDGVNEYAAKGYVVISMVSLPNGSYGASHTDEILVCMGKE